MSGSPNRHGPTATPLCWGGFKAGQIAFPVAVVMFESGDIRTVRADAVTVDGAGSIFRQYAWLDGDE